MTRIIAAFVSGGLMMTIGLAQAAHHEATTADFATGNMADAVKGMDSNGDGLISRDEYLQYETDAYDHDASRVATGNMTDAVRAVEEGKRAAYLKARGDAYGKLAGGSAGGVKADDMLNYLKGAAEQ